MRQFICTAVFSICANLLCETTAVAASFESGDSLYSKCQAPDYANRSLCLGYVMGAIDAFLTAQEVRPKPLFCIPEHFTAKQLADVVIKYIRTYPNKENATASSLVLVAVGYAFPCPNQQALGK